MSRLSVLRDRRSAPQSQSRQQSFLVFRLGPEQFALSLLAVQKVSLLGSVFGDPQRSGLSLTLHEGNELVVIDVQRRILNQPESASPRSRAPFASNDSSTPTYLIIVENSRGQAIGLPVDSKPKIQAFSEQGLKALPPTYQQGSAIQCVSALMIASQDQPIFVLNPDLVCHAANPNFVLDTPPTHELEGLSNLDELETLLQDSPASDVSTPNLADQDDSIRATLESQWLSSTTSVSVALVKMPESIDWETLSFDELDFLAGSDTPTSEATLPLDPMTSGSDAAIAAPDSFLARLDDGIDWAALPLDALSATELLAMGESPSGAENAPEHHPALNAPDDFEDVAEAIVLEALSDAIDWESLPLEALDLEIPQPHPDLPTSPTESMESADINREEDTALDWASLPLDDLDFFAPLDTPLDFS